MGSIVEEVPYLYLVMDRWQLLRFALDAYIILSFQLSLDSVTLLILTPTSIELPVIRLPEYDNCIWSNSRLHYRHPLQLLIPILSLGFA